jgi:hypothetical protein
VLAEGFKRPAEHMTEAVREAVGAHQLLATWRAAELAKEPAEFTSPSTQEVMEYSPHLGIDSAAEGGLLWLAEELLSAPVAGGWTEKVKSTEGDLYEDRLYYRSEAGKESRDHPLLPHYRSVLGRLREIDGELRNRCASMCEDLQLTPPAETVKDAWQERMEGSLLAIFQFAVQRHAVIREHYSALAPLLPGGGGDATQIIVMSKRLRSHRSGAKGGKRRPQKKSAEEGAKKQLVSKASWKRLQTTSDRVTAAQRAVSAARPAEAEDLRVLGAGVTGKMLLAGARPEC